MLADDQQDSSELAYNRMLALAESSISSYFYGMEKQLGRLSHACDQAPDELIAQSFGQVAYRIGRICDDDSLLTSTPAAAETEQSKKLCCERSSRLQTSQSFSRRPRYTPEARAAILAFMEPLRHLSAWKNEEEDPIPFSEWKRATLQGDRIPDDHLLSIEERASPDDYLQNGFVACKSRCPEVRLFNAFWFTASHYCDAAARISGQGSRIEEALAPFNGEGVHLSALIGKLMRGCWGRSESSDEFGLYDHIYEWAGITFGSEPTPEADALAQRSLHALYLLFIQPYALIYKESKNH